MRAFSVPYVFGLLLITLAGNMVLPTVIALTSEEHDAARAFVLALVLGRLLSRTAMGQALVLQEAETGFLSAPTASDLVGQIGEALTDLRPAGKVTVAGQRHEATSEREFIARGARVRVIGKEGPALVVRAEGEP